MLMRETLWRVKIVVVDENDKFNAEKEEEEEEENKVAVREGGGSQYTLVLRESRVCVRR